MPLSCKQLRSSPVFAAVLSLGLAGCGGPWQERLNAPPQGDSDRRSQYQSHYAYMNDNAMLRDMSFFDTQFVPNQPYLNGSGEARLERYSELLKESGGTLHYVAAYEDDKLTAARLAAMKKCLADGGYAGARIEIEAGLQQGRASDATYAIDARKRGNSLPQATAGTSGGASGTMTGTPTTTGGTKP